MPRFLNKILTPSFIIFLLALIVRFGFLAYQFKFSETFQSRPYIPTADRRYYDSMATSFLKGYGLNWYNIQSVHYPPVYPIFLSFLYSFFGHSYYSYLLVFLVQAGLSSLGSVFVFLIGKRVFNPVVGLLAGLGTSLYLPFIMVAQDLGLENLVIFMPLLFMVTLIKAEKKNTLGNQIMAGVIMGLTILTKAVFLMVLPLLVFLWFKTSKLKNNWKAILIICLSAGVILSVWLGRNYLLYKKFLFSSQSGAAFWVTTHPSYGRYNREAVRTFFWAKPELNEAENNDFYVKKGMENLKKYPILYFKRVVKNWRLLFYQRSPNDLSILLALLASMGFILALIKKNRRALVLFLLFILFLSQYSLLFAYPRFRMPLDWILILLAAYALSYPAKQLVSPRLEKYLKTECKKSLRRWGLIVVVILLAQFLTKIGLVYLFPKKVTNLPSQSGLNYLEVHDYQKEHQGSIEPFLNQQVVWTGEINYLNHNAWYPLGSAKHSERNENPEYAGFYDIYYLPSTTYSAFDLTVNRGQELEYYGDGVVMVNYKGSLIGKMKNGDMVTVSGKIIGQNFLGQIYVEGIKIYK